MSRVSWIMMNPGGHWELTRAVREALDGLTSEVAAQAGVPLDDILEVTLVGNPVMHHLALGIDPVELGGAPFALATDQGDPLSGRRRSTWRSTPTPGSTRCRASPGMSAPTPPGSCCRRARISRTSLRLIVDVGTNAEIVLGNRHRLLACSSPTGSGLRGSPDQLRPARRAGGRSSVSGSTPRPWSPGSR